MTSPQKSPFDYTADIATALATEGGHLSIGPGGFTLHYREGAMLSGYGCEAIKSQSIEAGLPVIDSRNVDLDMVLQLTLHGPLVAVGREPEPAPWYGLSYAPLEAVAAAYAAAGAEIWNIEGIELFEAVAKGSTVP
ncbi:hypothetical protein ACFFTN_13085 [Aminobacter aganoensis]|uniref:Uncharacterized protein n=1 Tax=Aminobacter aganoensis TaxID=83264 RepID=A0A7X0KM75_9HYPH|nr:hypothetical protein [Aminobacter aganoensis]MBB6355754.1 hypothetical protein [Aminobacter aganoensis]